MCTIIVFVKQRQFQRRGTYLVIHLAIVDLLVGLISGPLQIERTVGELCDLWDYSTKVTWEFHLKFALLHLFSMASFGNLAAISFERMQATFFPTKHLFMNKRFYYVIIAVIWLMAVIRESVQIALTETRSFDPELFSSTLYLPYYSISLLIICISYISIFIKTRCNAHGNPRGNGSTIRERRLTFTLFTVTVASILCLLPAIVFISLGAFHFESSLKRLSLSSHFHIRMTVVMFFLANSLANPIIYSMRMRGFRAGLALMVNRVPNHVNGAPNTVELHHL